MSSRRSTSLVVALGVASLAATSLAAMVATSELLTESITHPLPEELDPPVPDLGRPGVIQVEPPERRRAKPSGGRSRAPATAPPPRRRSATRENGAAAAGDGGRAGVVAAVQRRPARQRPVVFRTPAAEPSVDRTPSPRPPVARPAPRPVRPPQRPEHGSPPRSWRRGAGHKPHPGRHDRDRAPSAPRPDNPRAADPNGKPGGGSPCPGRSHPEERTDRHHSRDTDSRWWVGPQVNAGGAGHQREPQRHEPGREENQPDGRSGNDDRPGGMPSQERQDQERQDQERQAEDPTGRHANRRDHDPREQRSAPTGHRDHDKQGTDR